MDYPEIKIDLPNGDKLVTAQCPHNSGQFAIGVEHNGIYIQDLVVAETFSDENGKYIPDKYTVYVFGNEYDESYTECFNIARVPDSELQ